SDRIVDAYAQQAENDVEAGEAVDARPPDAAVTLPPFDALVEEAMGLIGAAIEPNAVRIGGELMATAGALESLGRSLHALGPDVDETTLGATIDRVLGPTSNVLLFGVRSLKSIATVVRAAWKNAQKRERPE